MSQPGMRVTLDAAMRARDVSRADAEADRTAGADTDGKHTDGDQPQASGRRPSKGERRRLGKRQAARRRDEQGTG